MIRFSAQAAYLLLGASTCSREDTYSGQGAYFFLEKQPNVQKKALIFI